MIRRQAKRCPLGDWDCHYDLAYVGLENERPFTDPAHWYGDDDFEDAYCVEEEEPDECNDWNELQA